GCYLCSVDRYFNDLARYRLQAELVIEFTRRVRFAQRLSQGHRIIEVRYEFISKRDAGTVLDLKLATRFLKITLEPIVVKLRQFAVIRIEERRQFRQISLGRSLLERIAGLDLFGRRCQLIGPHLDQLSLGVCAEQLTQVSKRPLEHRRDLLRRRTL